MKRQNQQHAGSGELIEARRESRGLYWAVGLFSFVANILMLTGPLYMLQVYDRVLGSRSLETLLALSLLVVFLYGIMGLLDYARGRVMGRVAARFQSRLERRVFDAVLKSSSTRPSPEARTGQKDLGAVQQLMASPVLMAVFDLPWTPVFLVGISLFHPWLGMLAVAGGAVLVVFTILNRTLSKRPLEEAAMRAHGADIMGEQIRSESEMVRAMGMQGAAFDRWQAARHKALTRQVQASDLTGSFGALTKTFRLMLQSAMLGLGAYLVLQNEMTPGAMIAGSILLGRALAPIELAIGQWALVQRAAQGWRNLGVLLSEVPPEEPRTQLPVPKARLEAQQVTVVPPGDAQAALRMVSFVVEPGQAVGVIGASGAGKSTLARAITGVWRPAGGTVRLDGATLDQYDPDKLGDYIGYLPQRIQLFDGTIADNIARLSQEPDSEKVVAAAKKAAAHDMIVKLPDGYDTRVTTNGGRLSGGQIQRIGLARAMYSDPAILVLDEPNSNLDNDGSVALNAAIRAMKSEGKSVLIMAHRPAAIQECDMLLVLDGGAARKFGPRDEVLKEMVQNHKEIQASTGAGGVR
ncbi:type I secretion system permease/ATPase [Shimia sediminis]|uniref:type I secretion system permease/ATPase n=1 Tax=Shimia sediminis TaxID=2497945 RepID=UPI000F8C8879|nr:type I secretion system permease/ATPase [Shimia sediminis]